ncbi:MAG: helix-turn-helix domain-containing protein [Clostridia bacterium]|nr:helix-turn-helix domain-containing protein [Clostridia bacterium]MBQ9265284.1 helix-turn-helix domain-containing protein [Clostridia bacterium]
MANQFMRADEVARELGISKSFAYKLIRQLNQELKERGFLTIAGRINRDYLRERLYTAESEVKQNVGL